MSENEYETRMKNHLRIVDEIEQSLLNIGRGGMHVINDEQFRRDHLQAMKAVGQLIARSSRAICAAIEMNTLEQMRNR